MLEDNPGTMKALLTSAMICLFTYVAAQEKPVKIVFDVTSSDETVHETAMRHITMMAKAYPESQFELVVYSGAINLVRKDKSVVADQVTALKDNDNVSIKVCQATMNRHKLNDSDLLPGVASVPDGILEIVQKQSEGWGYIKEAPNN
jgi:intracellular sulfur oxidation DsrE/DsrF family protein